MIVTHWPSSSRLSRRPAGAAVKRSPAHRARSRSAPGRRDADIAPRSPICRSGSRAALAEPGRAVRDARSPRASLWVRATRRTLGAIPLTVDGTSHEPYRTWLATHAADVVYSEPAGQWLLHVRAISGTCTTHIGRRRRPSRWRGRWSPTACPASARATRRATWPASTNSTASICARHPRGAHAAEAVDQIRHSNEQSVDLTSGREGGTSSSTPPPTVWTSSRRPPRSVRRSCSRVSMRRRLSRSSTSCAAFAPSDRFHAVGACRAKA